MTQAIELPDLVATEALALAIAHALQPPLVIGLVGDLGAGKTAFARALIQVLAPGTRVKSPSYSLVESYALPWMQIHHLDLYRLRAPEELIEIGIGDLLSADAVLLIEWPEQGGAQTPPLDVQIAWTRLGESARTVHLSAASEAGRRLLLRAGLA